MSALGLAVIIALTGLAVLVGISAKRNRTVLTDHTVTLTSEGVVEETVFNRNEVYWPGVDRVVDAGGYVCVHPGQFSAYIIPASAFQSEEQRREFVQYAVQRLEAARSTSAA